MKAKNKKYFNRLSSIKNINITEISLVFLFFALSLYNLAVYFFSAPPIITIPIKSDTRTEALMYWKDFLTTHPDYYSGWIEMAKLEYQNKNLTAASFALDQAYKINPNSSEIRYYRMIIK